MATVTKYPTIIVNSVKEAYESDWSGLSNLNADDDTDAQCQIQGGTVLTGSRSDDPTSASTSGEGFDWYDPGAAADGSIYYYADVYSGGGYTWSKYLELRGMSFSIPATASNGGSNEISRVKVEVVCSGQGYSRTMELRLVTTGGTVCNPINQSMPTSKATLTYDYTNTQWGLPSDLSSSTGLGVNIRIQTNGTNAGVYFVKVTVYYKSGETTKQPNGIYATDCDVDLNDNARINNVKVVWEEYLRNTTGGTSNIPQINSKTVTLLKANNGENVSQISSLSVPTGRTQRELTFDSSVMPDVRRANIEDPDFGIYFCMGSNASSNQGLVYLDYLRVVVDFTDPTYSLSAELSTGKVLGEQLIYTLTLKNTNSCHEGVNIPVTITLPSGLSVASQSGDGTYDTGTHKWDAVLDSTRTAVLTLTLDTTTAGSKTINASVDDFSTSLDKSTVVLSPTYILSSPSIKEHVTETYNVTYTITVEVDTSAVSSVDVNIPIPSGLQFVSAEGSGSYNSSTKVWTAVFTNQTATLSLTIKGITVGTINQVITTNAASFTKKITVLPATLSVPYHTEIDLPDEILTYLKDGEVYTLSCWSIVTDSELEYVYPGDQNFTIAVVNGDNEFLSDKAESLDTPSRISTRFIYNKDAPIKLRIYGQWLEINPGNASHEVGGFALYHEKQLIDNPNLMSGSNVRENITTGSDFLANTNGTSAYNGASIESSTEWSSEGDRSFKIILPGSVVDESVYFLTNTYDRLPTQAGDYRIAFMKIKGSGNFRLTLMGRDGTGAYVEYKNMNVTAMEPPQLINISNIFTDPDVKYCDIKIIQASTPNPVEIYIDTIKFYDNDPLVNVEGKTDYELPALLFDDPDSLLLDGDYAEISLPPNRIGEGITFPDLHFGGLEGDSEVIIKGLMITGDVSVPGDINIGAILSTEEGDASQSIIISSDDTTFQIGGETDRWGLNRLKLSDLYFTLIFSNIGVDTILALLKNISIIIYYMYDETAGNRGFTLDGVHSREYNVFLVDGWDKPDGLNNDLQTFKLTRSDGEKLTASTVVSKEFKIKFQIVADTLEEANERLKEITAWMTNDRDENQKPITKAMVFDWDPDREYNVVLNDTIDIDFTVGSFEGSAKFLLPEGVGHGPQKVTGSTGRNNGLIPIRPVLQVVCSGADEVLITDSVSGQFMNIQHTFEEGTILTIDHQKRTVKDNLGNSYLTDVSLDSYWFKIQNEYDFNESTGCLVQTVTFQEAI